MRENERANQVLLLLLSSLHELFVTEEPHDVVVVALISHLNLRHHLWNWLRRTCWSLVIIPVVVLEGLWHLLLLSYNSRAHTHPSHSLWWCAVLLVVLRLILLRIAILLLWVVLAIGHSCHAILILVASRIHVHLVASLSATFVVVQLAHQKTK